MAEYITVKAHTLYKIPDNVNFEKACLTEPFAVGMHAVRLAGTLADKTVVIIGAGTIVCIGSAAQTIPFPLQECIVKQISILCSYSSEGEYPLCLKAISEGAVPMDEFIRNTMPLSEGASAFQRLIVILFIIKRLPQKH